MARKPGLGRGLDALFADVAPVSEEEYIQDDRQLIDESNATEILTAATNVKGEKKASTSEVQEKDRVLYIDINDIKPNSAQPRVNFDESKLNELAESIRINGVIQPLIVRRGKNGYEIVAGERRYRASKLANKDTIPAIIRELDDFEGENLSIIENIQREDLNPYDEAVAYKSIIDKYELTQEEDRKSTRLNSSH